MFVLSVVLISRRCVYVINPCEVISPCEVTTKHHQSLSYHTRMSIRVEGFRVVGDLFLCYQEMPTHTYTYIHAHTYIHIHIHTYTYIHTYIHIHTYNNIQHTYTYIHTQQLSTVPMIPFFFFGSLAELPGMKPLSHSARR
eukprot:GHVQ01042445.1.p1 GENE.GHVQ01042445.1~~GHVQ01042445.1.p1  ORF type:complete len:140 (+),score=3.81 GHVQ01042445.1:95-514(+)